MLRGLDIRDILIVDRLVLDFRPGLNVLTGETGAGKSILLDALGFVLGWRGRAELVRDGAAQGVVTAWFDLAPDHAARAILDEAGIPVEDELILRRVNTAQGRKTAWINDSRVSGEVLRRLSDTLVELHGQQDDRGLLDAGGHRALLDAFGGHDDLRAATRSSWNTLRDARKALSDAEAALEEVRGEEDFLRHATAELEAFDPQPGEAAALDSRRRLMQSAERVLGDIQRAEALLAGEQGAEASAAGAMRLIETAAEPLGALAEAPLAALDRALVELAEAQSGLAACLAALDADPAALDATADRLFSLRELARKHHVAPDDLAAAAETLRARLARIETGAEHLDALKTAQATAERAYADAAGRLGLARRDAAQRLDTAMAAELAPLKMERAVFSTELGPALPGPEGQDMIAFQVATNPGAPAGPLNRIASGGELSRFLLALKVCLTGEGRGVTLIFDEIDRGVGGATADAVGRRLAALADPGQVLVVTHSPQVAALGHHHWRVEKRIEGDRTLSSVIALRNGDRVDEIARMLSGNRITAEARSAARALLAP